MKVKVYRNLDRPFTLFGIKGDFIGVMIAEAVVSLVIATIAGTATSSFIGLGVFAVLLFVGYFSVSLIQEKHSGNEIGRLLSGARLPKVIVINEKPWKKSE
ncbi:MAG: hypothetical protein MJZ16_08470 [Bacteroidales bacterium]|nr:hypothetical protein [Bacteroidales bacterium]